MGSVRAQRSPRYPSCKDRRGAATQSAHVARIDGAISGTPFFIALVPGYLTYLQQEMRMTLRTAALYDRDPGNLRTWRRCSRCAECTRTSRPRRLR